MADLPEPDADHADDATEQVEPSAATSTTPRRRRSLDARTIAICVVLGIVAALLTVLIASLVSSDDATGGGMELQKPGSINSEALLTQPLATVDGGETDLAAFQQDQPMLVNLWASNCAPCIDEMPLLNDAQRDNPDITFVGIATQDDLTNAKDLAEQTGISYPWALDPTGEFFFEAKGQGMPTTLLLDASGSVLDTKTGSFDNATELQAFLDQAG